MYEMKPEYYIGIDMIDEEHKQLFKYADEAYELLLDEFTPDKYDRIDIILENLRNYTVKQDVYKRQVYWIVSGCSAEDSPCRMKQNRKQRLTGSRRMSLSKSGSPAGWRQTR